MKVIKCFEVRPENIRTPCGQFTKELQKIRRSMRTSTKEDCKAILYYVPIVSRAGSDIEAALKQLDSFGDKYIALVALHHTFDRELITPDSSRIVNRDEICTVDCLFSEDEGLFPCCKNVEAIKKVAAWLKDVKHKKKQTKKQKNRRLRNLAKRKERKASEENKK